MGDKCDTMEKIVNKWTCEMATDRNLTRCPLHRIPEKFYGTLILKVVNGEIKQIIKEESLAL